MNAKYFSADGTELKGPFGLENKKFSALFPGVTGKRWDSFSMLCAFPDGSRYTLSGEGSMPVSRVIYYKSNPSLHKCDARCLNAKGRNCECACGGRNHGAGQS
jgi:hypothetical protein